MNQHALILVFPGDLETRTGGYRYDKRIVEGLADKQAHFQPWNVSTVSLEGDYPFPTDAQLKQAAAQFDLFDDDALVVVDGLAFSVMPEIMELHTTRLRIVALIHHPLALETGLTATQSKQLKALETRALRCCRHVITTSALTADSLAGYEVPPGKVTAICPGTDLMPLSAGSQNSIPTLLCVATLTPRKGHQVLLDALSELTHLKWQLNCVGSTDRHIDTYNALLAQRSKLAMDDRVSFLGELNDDSLQHAYHQADVFVLASYHEGFGMVLTEAIAHGLPIVCSDAGAMAQTAPKGAALLVAPGNPGELAGALSSFLTDPELGETLRQTAREARANLRSWQQAVTEFDAVLRTVSSH